jgi:hypothetical protein
VQPTRSAAARATVGLSAATVLVLAGCLPATQEDALRPADSPASTSAGAGSAAQQPGPRRVRRAHATLAQLTQVDRSPELPAYSRDAFGVRWKDTDGNGCNQRDDVLLRDAVPGSTVVAQQGRCDHDVLAGTWHDPFTGRVHQLTDMKDLGQAQTVQIDHVVPLAEAWRSGAAAWSDDRRERFANDLPGLLAVDGPTNMSKGDDDPAAWRPRKGFQCWYAVIWVETKGRWDLRVDDSEVRGLREMLAYC